MTVIFFSYILLEGLFCPTFFKKTAKVFLDSGQAAHLARSQFGSVFWIIILEFSSSVKHLVYWESFCQSVFLHSNRHGAVSKSYLPNTFSAIITLHLCASLLGIDIHVGVLGHVNAKHAGPHMSQTNLFWCHLSKGCAPNSKV